MTIDYDLSDSWRAETAHQRLAAAGIKAQLEMSIVLRGLLFGHRISLDWRDGAKAEEVLRQWGLMGEKR